LLPNPALKKTWDRLVWVYVYRDFSKSEADKKAERILLRMGVTSWPQLLLADPGSLEILGHTGRSVESFLKAVERVRVEKRTSAAAVDRAREAEAEARKLARRRSVREAEKALAADDIVLRRAALRVLASRAPRKLAPRATELLKVPNDPFRFEVCKALEDAADPGAADALETLLTDETEGSLNPNVLRIRAVAALARCGGAGSVDAIARWAATGEYFNGLTGTAVDALAAIAKRHKRARKAVDAALRRAYPEPPEAGDARAHRACLALAKRVHRARGVKAAFPDPYDAKAWRKLTGK
jgi:hypothetical protein